MVLYKAPCTSLLCQRSKALESKLSFLCLQLICSGLRFCSRTKRGHKPNIYICLMNAKHKESWKQCRIPASYLTVITGSSAAHGWGGHMGGHMDCTAGTELGGHQDVPLLPIIETLRSERPLRSFSSTINPSLTPTKSRHSVPHLPFP